MPLTAMRRRDAAALVLATVTAFAGLTTWLIGEVDLGVRLGAAGDEAHEGFVQIVDVVPDSVAEYYGFAPGGLVVEIHRRDGSMAAQRNSPYPNEGMFDQPGEHLRLVTEWVPESDIEYLYAVGIDPEHEAWDLMTWGASLSRWSLLSRLEGGGILLLVGIGLGLAAAAAVSRGWLGEARRVDSTVAGVAVATPLMALPLIYTGMPGTGVAGVGLTALGVLPLAWSLAGAQADAAWARRLRWVAIGLAAFAVVIAARALFGSEGGQRQGSVLAAAIVMVPAVGTALSGSLDGQGRLQLIAMGAVPAAAIMVGIGTFPELLPLVLVVTLIAGWRLLPAALAARMSGTGASLWASTTHDATDAAAPVGGSAEALEPGLLEREDPAARARRDAAALSIAGAAFAAGVLACCETGAIVFGALFGAIVAFALHRGLLGPGWRTAAIPLGCAVAVPIMALSLSAGGGTPHVVRLLLPAAAALPVAHLLAARHPDPQWRRGLFVVSMVLAGVVALITLSSSVGGPLPDGPYDIVDPGNRLAIYLSLGFIALVPALGSALADAPQAFSGPTGRLDTLAIGLTPGAAMTVLPASAPTFWLLGLWIIAVVAWRRFTIAPLLGLAQRTQRQRDLAVAAVEAERARLASDLHDDALQELSALVRRLDAAGDAENADLARGVAERLRAITSDLRLPLLDDLGAGPALEWLVGRVRPLADGEVTLERADPTRPPPNVELAIFRVAQEAIANAVKHGATPITVRYRVADDGGVSLSIDDAGPGIEPGAAERALQAGHLGMANMQQRAQQIGALLDIRRWPTGGTHVALEWRPQ